MAVKKSATPKTSSTPKAASTKKAAPKKAAPKKATTKKAPPKKSTMPAEAKAKAKPAAAKKAPAIKLSDSQTRVLGLVQQAGDAGYAAGKGEGKVLESLLKKKLVKRGKKVDGSPRFLVTKAGAKHVPAPAPAAPSSPRRLPPPRRRPPPRPCRRPESDPTVTSTPRDPPLATRGAASPDPARPFPPLVHAAPASRR